MAESVGRIGPLGGELPSSLGEVEAALMAGGAEMVIGASKLPPVGSFEKVAALEVGLGVVVDATLASGLPPVDSFEIVAAFATSFGMVVSSSCRSRVAARPPVELVALGTAFAGCLGLNCSPSLSVSWFCCMSRISERV